jgi:hypothetical protein
MDWDAAIERNREALKRVLAGLMVMARMAGGTRPTSHGSRPTADCLQPTAATLPRRLHRLVLRLLRPAEAAARRLVIIAARNIVVAAPAPQTSARPAKPRPPLARAVPIRGFGLAVRAPLPVDPPRPARPPCLPLFDTLPRFGKRRSSRSGTPRISFPGFLAPFPVRPAPTPFDPIETTGIGHRFAALEDVLDDLPRHAGRFARWRARRDAALMRAREAASLAAQGGDPAPRWQGRFRPLRPGRPPGRHPARSSTEPHEVHAILDITHGLAVWALEPPDTS